MIINFFKFRNFFYRLGREKESIKKIIYEKNTAHSSNFKIKLRVKF